MLTWLRQCSPGSSPHRIGRSGTRPPRPSPTSLSQRLLLAARLLGDFASVNDPYVLERLLAACYGAALQGTRGSGNSANLPKWFSTRYSPTRNHRLNALLRDHARGIVEYAAWRGVLNSSIDPALARPPYQSSWPIEPVPDELIKSYTEDHVSGGSFPTRLSALQSDDMGDFAKYVVDHKVNRWSPAKLGTTCRFRLRATFA